MGTGAATKGLGGRRVGHGLLIVGAGLVAASSAIHLHLWLTGYRHISTIGPMFLGQVIAGFALALGLAATRRPLLGAAAFIFAASTIGGFALSVWVGLFGFHDSLSAPWAGTALIIELAALAVLAAGVWRSLDHPLRLRTGPWRVGRHPNPVPG